MTNWRRSTSPEPRWFCPSCQSVTWLLSTLPTETCSVLAEFRKRIWRGPWWSELRILLAYLAMCILHIGIRVNWRDVISRHAAAPSRPQWAPWQTMSWDSVNSLRRSRLEERGKTSRFYTSSSKTDAHGVMGMSICRLMKPMGSACRYNFFKGCPKAKTCTIILRGGAEQFTEETERSLHDAIMIVRRAIKVSGHRERTCVV